jgi:hypothetical protein
MSPPPADQEEPLPLESLLEHIVKIAVCAC